MPRTINKGIRFTDAELECAAQLLAQLPEHRSEAELLRHAAWLGMLVLATQATRPGLPPYASYQPDDLAALLKPRLLPAIDFLAERGALPLLVAAPHAVEATPVGVVEVAAAAELEGLGTGFMDD